MSAAADVVLIGAGHNALVCATLLARAGRRVRIVEASPRIGGAPVTREFASGYRASAPAHFVYALSPRMARELELERHGLRWLARRLPSIALTADVEYFERPSTTASTAHHELARDAVGARDGPHNHAYWVVFQAEDPAVQRGRFG